MSEIKLGDLVRDRMTGFEGVVVCVSQWLYGCRRITVQPKELREGKVVDNVSFDEMQVEVVHAGEFKPIASPQVAPVFVAGAQVGGPRPSPDRGR